MLRAVPARLLLFSWRSTHPLPQSFSSLNFSARLSLPCLSAHHCIPTAPHGGSQPSCRFFGGLTSGLVFYTKSHDYIVVEGVGSNEKPNFEDSKTLLRLGITRFAQNQLGEIVFVDLPDVDRKVKKGENIVSVESVKAVGEIYAPIDGTVVEVNQNIREDCSLVNTDPEGEGWLVKLAAEQSESGSAPHGFLTHEEYVERCQKEETE